MMNERHSESVSKIWREVWVQLYLEGKVLQEAYSPQTYPLVGTGRPHLGIWTPYVANAMKAGGVQSQPSTLIGPPGRTQTEQCDLERRTTSLWRGGHSQGAFSNGWPTSNGLPTARHQHHRLNRALGEFHLRLSVGGQRLQETAV